MNNNNKSFKAIEIVSHGKTDYKLSEALDLSGTAYNLIHSSGEKEGPFPVTPNMIVGFSTAVRSAKRPVTVVYPNTETDEETLTACFNISITGEYNSPAPKKPFPQAGKDDTGVKFDLFKPSGISQEQMNNDIINTIKNIINNGDFLVDPETAEDHKIFRMVIEHSTDYIAKGGAHQVTCSESHGYGMYLLVLMAGADKELGIDVKAYFDGMFRSLRQWKGLDDKKTEYLMNWEIRTDNKWKTPYGGSWNNGGSGTATDGSLDMAYALLLASIQWDISDDGQNYLEYAKLMVDEIWRTEVRKATPPGNYGTFYTTAGSWIKQTGDSRCFTRPSDHMIHHFKVFDALRLPGNDWDSLVSETYKGLLNIIMQQNPPTGILPDFASVQYENSGDKKHGEWWSAPGQLLETPQDGTYHWNACRVPWRLALDTMLCGTSPLTELAVKRLNELQNEWTNGEFTEICSRQLNGTPISKETGFDEDTKDPAFWGPALVPASLFGPQKWFDAAWSWARNHPWQGDKYGDYLTALGMLAASGNEWSPLVTPGRPGN
ncbi:MAG: glycosyl hydrolase family 8 [Oscillospiraceae bacterium]|nr:glycosyl hydrolase family 8 [Oscillospiraceae bacterium]